MAVGCAATVAEAGMVLVAQMEEEEVQEMVVTWVAVAAVEDGAGIHSRV